MSSLAENRFVELARACLCLLSSAIAGCGGSATGAVASMGGSGGPSGTVGDASIDRSTYADAIAIADEGADVSGDAIADGTVDRAGHCPRTLEYFISVEGDGAPQKLTRSCSDFSQWTEAPSFFSGTALEQNIAVYPEVVACEGESRIEVWEVAEGPGSLFPAAGVYTSSSGRTYSTCADQHKYPPTCTAAGQIQFVNRSDFPFVREGTYATTVLEAGSGVRLDLKGSYRVCIDAT